MKKFAALYTALDSTTKTNDKVAAMAAYFRDADPRDAAWAVYFLTGRRLKRLIESRKLWTWAVELTGLPDWLVGECYDAVGDTAETIALLLPHPEPGGEARPLHWWIEEQLLTLRHLDDDARRGLLVRSWRQLSGNERFVWNKLITGAFRVGVSQSLVTRALAEVSGVDANTVAHRLMGDWSPTADFAAQFLSADSSDADISKPYPFCLAHPLDADPATLGGPGDWIIEWKWDGIRAQLVRRKWRTFLWSRGEELITERFPEIDALGALLPDGTVIDGEVLPVRDGKPMPFAQLQRRIGRKVLGPKILADVPAALVAYDLLEDNGRDIRDEPLEARRARLAELASRAASDRLILSPVVEPATWEEAARLREESRERGVEGFMLKRLGSPYRTGRRRGDWWKWKISPFTVDAVLIYAQRGSGKRASLYTDYTFGVWDGDRLVPFAKAYSGLDDAEIREVDAFIRRHTTEKFGPVRTVEPELVFELAFEGIQKSTRHKSGIAVRFPRIARWRKDKKPADADSLESVRKLLP